MFWGRKWYHTCLTKRTVRVEIWVIQVRWASIDHSFDWKTKDYWRYGLRIIRQHPGWWLASQLHSVTHLVRVKRHAWTCEAKRIPTVNIFTDKFFTNCSQTKVFLRSNWKNILSCCKKSFKDLRYIVRRFVCTEVSTCFCLDVWTNSFCIFCRIQRFNVCRFASLQHRLYEMLGSGHFYII